MIWNHNIPRIARIFFNPEGKEKCWRSNPPRPQTVLRSYNNQNALYRHKKRHGAEWRAQRQTHTLRVSSSLTKEERTHNGGKTVSSSSGAGKARRKSMKFENTLTAHTQT